MSAWEEEEETDEVGARKRLFTPSPSPSSPAARKMLHSSPSPSPSKFYSRSPSWVSSSPHSPVRLFSASPKTRNRIRLGSRCPQSQSPQPRSSSPPNSPATRKRIRLGSRLPQSPSPQPRSPSPPNSPATRKRIRLGSASPVSSYLPPSSSPQSHSRSPSPNFPCHSPSCSPDDNDWQKDLLTTTADSAPVTPSSLSTSFLADTLSGKFLFLFFSHVVGPMAASLYAINLWNPSVFSSDITCDHSQPTDIEPIIEFDCKQFPTDMSCVELNSKLYFLGGNFSHRWDPPDSVSRSRFEDEREELKMVRVENHSLVDFYVLDISYAINCCNTSDSSSNSPGAPPGSNTSSSSSSSSRWSGASSNSYQMLKKCSPMHSSKHRAYAFVAFGKIYVISGIGKDTSGFPSFVDRFEVFDPDLDKWTVLDDPPINDVVTSHSVIRDRVYISTSYGLMYSYDPHKGNWRPCWENHSFYGQADSIGTTLYGWNYYDGVTAYGLFTDEGVSSTSQARASSGVAYLNRTKAMLPLLLMTGETDYSYDCTTPRLVHLGNRVFCYVIHRNSPDLDGPNDYCHKVDIRVTHFELPQDPYRSTVKEGEDPGREFLFDFKFINSAYFAGKSRYGSYKHILQNCFHVPIQ